jgi:hypothetical protein
MDCVQGLLVFFSYIMALLNFPKTVQKAWHEPTLLNVFVVIVGGLVIALPILLFFASLSSSHR